MNLLNLNLSYIRRRLLDTLIVVALLALGISTITFLLICRDQLENSLQRDARGIDLVVGAKGSPLQLILSSVYHVDVPTGNIDLHAAEEISGRAEVRASIPLALGDTYRAYPIVGSTHAYPAHYGARLADGTLWEEPLQVVLGARVAQENRLSVGARILSAHGVGGPVHAAAPMRVVGILGPTGTVIDRLVLTGLETVWRVHGTHAAENEDAHGDEHGDGHHGPTHAEAHGDDHHEPTHATQPEEEREITALLVQYRSPISATTFPRFINQETPLQAASPAFETARLFVLLGSGITLMRALGLVLVLAAALGLFATLYKALRERRYDMAMLRVMGASRLQLLGHVLLEGLLLTLLGAAAGLALGHAAVEAVARYWLADAPNYLTGWTWGVNEAWLLLLALLVGALASLMPALAAYRTDISRVLAEQ